MDIPSLDDYYLKNGQFVLKSSFSKALRYGMMIGIIIGGIFATSTKATVAYLEPYTWQFTKSKYTDYILAANKNVSNRDAVSIVNSIFKWSEHFNIKPELLFAIAKVESRFDKHAISSAGAMGLMQVLYKVHVDKIIQAKSEIGNPEIFSIDGNIYTGAKILKACLDKFNLTKSLAVCYNGGVIGNGYDVKVLSEVRQLGIKI